jgi:outer membrane cobalamin receptor
MNYLRLSAFAYTGSNGVPGKIITPSYLAKSQKMTVSAGLNFSRKISEKSEIGLDYSYMGRKTSYIDYLGEIRYLTKYTETENTASLKCATSPTGGLKLNLQTNLTYGMLDGRDNLRPQYALGKLHRKSYGFDVAAAYDKIIGKILIAPNLSSKIESVDSHRYNSYYSSLAFCYIGHPSGGVMFSYGRAYRLPGLAELNWKEDIFVIANPLLKPERSKSRSVELFAELELAGKWRSSIEYQDTRYNDLIFWRRSQGFKYKPINISASDYFGTIVTFSYKSPSEILSLDFSRTMAVSLNRENGQPYNGKDLTFQPRYINHLNLRLAYQSLNTGIGMQDVSQRYYLEENTKALHPYALFDIRLGYECKLKYFTLGGEYKIDNLTNAHYELLEYQPMPPRCQSICLKIKI